MAEHSCFEHCYLFFSLGLIVSRTSTNGHLSTTAAPQQRPLFWADSAYNNIDSCLNFSTMATFFCPHGDRYGEVLRSFRQKQWPLWRGDS